MQLNGLGDALHRALCQGGGISFGLESKSGASRLRGGMVALRMDDVIMWELPDVPSPSGPLRFAETMRATASDRRVPPSVSNGDLVDISRPRLSNTRPIGLQVERARHCLQNGQAFPGFGCVAHAPRDGSLRARQPRIPAHGGTGRSHRSGIQPYCSSDRRSVTIQTGRRHGPGWVVLAQDTGPPPRNRWQQRSIQAEAPRARELRWRRYALD
jgi:hypothetical protein